MGERSLGILSGIKILSFTQFLLGPAGVQYLGDMGADVVKIEPPGKGAWERTWAGGDTFKNDVSIFYLLAHRNVHSLTLNLKHPAAQEVARRLVSEADVLVQNFRPGVVDKFGLGYDRVRQINPRIIYASASGYGDESPSRNLPGQDILLQAMSGLVWLNERVGTTPVPAGAAIVDQHGAALLALGILAALFHRERTGEGQKIEVTMLQSALDLQMEPLSYYLNGGQVQPPTTPLGSAFHPAPYGVYPTQDGYLALSLSPVSLLREALGGVPDLAPYEEPGRALKEREAIYRILAQHLRRRPTREWLAILQQHNVWCAAVNDYSQMVGDPAVQYLDPFFELDHPQAGTVRLLRHPINYSIGTPGPNESPPSLGQQTDEILTRLGYTQEEIDRLHKAGAA